MNDLKRWRSVRYSRHIQNLRRTKSISNSILTTSKINLKFIYLKNINFIQTNNSKEHYKGILEIRRGTGVQGATINNKLIVKNFFISRLSLLVSKCEALIPERTKLLQKPLPTLIWTIC